MKLNYLAIIGVTTATVMSCTPARKEYASYELYPVRSGSLTEMEYTPATLGTYGRRSPINVVRNRRGRTCL